MPETGRGEWIFVVLAVIAVLFGCSLFGGTALADLLTIPVNDAKARLEHAQAARAQAEAALQDERNEAALIDEMRADGQVVRLVAVVAVIVVLLLFVLLLAVIVSRPRPAAPPPQPMYYIVEQPVQRPMPAAGRQGGRR